MAVHTQVVEVENYSQKNYSQNAMNKNITYKNTKQITMPEQLASLLMEKAETVFREKFSDLTQGMMRRLWWRYQNFITSLREYGHLEEEEIYLAAFCVHLNEAECVKGQTIAQYLCHLQNEYKLRGIQLNFAKVETLKTAMAKRATPSIRANPMTLSEVRTLLQLPQLTDHEKAFVAIYWTSGQRPDDLIAQKVEETSLILQGEELQIAMWMTQHTKNVTDQERSSPRCVRILIPKEWRNLVETVLWNARARNELFLFHSVELPRLDQVLRRLPVRIRHPLLKENHTLYSIRCGALQHLAAQGVNTGDIASLTRHASEGSLRAYIGSYLDPMSVRGLEISKKLGTNATVPPEYDQRASAVHSIPLTLPITDTNLTPPEYDQRASAVHSIPPALPITDINLNPECPTEEFRVDASNPSYLKENLHQNAVNAFGLVHMTDEPRPKKKKVPSYLVNPLNLGLRSPLRTRLRQKQAEKEKEEYLANEAEAAEIL